MVLFFDVNNPQTNNSRLLKNTFSIPHYQNIPPASSIFPSIFPFHHFHNFSTMQAMTVFTSYYASVLKCIFITCRLKILSFISHEKYSNRTRTAMCSNTCSYIINRNIAFNLRKSFRNLFF